jgi:hypothetical protein
MPSQNNLPGLLRTNQRAWLFGFVLSVGVIILYSLTLTRHYSGDDIQKAIIVENGIPGTYIWHPVNLEKEPDTLHRQIVNPRYFLEVPIARLLMKLFRYFGWSDRALLPMQFNHLLLGLMGVIGFYLGALRLTRPFMAFILSIGLASSYGWWYFSTHPDFVLAGSAFLAVALACLINLLLTRKKMSILILSIGLGISVALAILFFLTSALFVPVIIFAVIYRFWHDFHDPRVGIISLSALISTLLLAVALLSGLIILVNDTRQQPIIEIVRTAIYLDSSASSWFSINLGDIPRGFLGISKSIVQYPPLGTQTPREFLSIHSGIDVVFMLAWFSIWVVIFALPFGLIAWKWKSLGLYRTIALVLIVWITIQIPFGILWVPTEVKWWIVILPGWFSLVALTSTLYLDSDYKYSLGVLGGLFFFICVLVINLTVFFWPQAQEDLLGARQASSIIVGLSSPKDLFISVSPSNMDIYLPYFEKRRVVSYPWALIMHGGKEQFVVDQIRVLVEDYAANSANVYLYDCSTEKAANLLELLGKATASREKLDLSGRWASFDTICRISNQ